MKLVVFGLAAVALLFFVAFGFAARDDEGGSADPDGSALSLVERFFPASTLTADDARSVGAPCLSGDRLVVAPSGACTFEVPGDVERVELRRVQGSGQATVTLDPPGDGLRQQLRTSGPADPLRFAVVDDPSRLEISCLGPQVCQLALAE
jgi:hypothetical protein